MGPYPDCSFQGQGPSNVYQDMPVSSEHTTDTATGGKKGAAAENPTAAPLLCGCSAPGTGDHWQEQKVFSTKGRAEKRKPTPSPWICIIPTMFMALQLKKD